MLRCGRLLGLYRRIGASSGEQRSLCVLLVVLAVTNLHGRFCPSHYDYISAEELPGRLVAQCVSSEPGGAPLCPQPDTLPQPLTVDETAVTDAEYAQIAVSPARHCTPRYTVSVIVPYRNRAQQLRIFLRHVHPLLRAQHLNYTIYIIEQSQRRLFNRAKLLNIGYAEVANMSSAAARSCFIFHDVDLLPEDAGNVYACTRRPRHLSARVSSMRYQLPYRGIAGGVLAILGDTFRRVNGYSNAYYGWGAEDDDFSNRLAVARETLARSDPRVSRYQMLEHLPEPPNDARIQLLRQGAARARLDGLSDLTYTVLDKQDRAAYQWIQVDI